MSEMKHVLFVDDQPNVVAGLRRMLHKMRNEWDMEFCTSGEEALKIMESKRFDLIVSDMMMPRMNGAQLLKKVSELYPETVRFILSGHSDRELVLQSVGFAHQYIAKPCDPDDLKMYLEKSLGLQKMLMSNELHEKIASIGSLPSPPAVYHELITELASETSSVKSIAAIVSKDVSLAAKMLQMVNSAFFGLPAHVESVHQAVNLLGLDTVRALILTAGVYSHFDNSEMSNTDIALLFSHSLRVGTNAKKIALKIGLSRNQSDDALLAGLMHDIGKLVIATSFRDEMKKIIKLVSSKSIQQHVAEKEVLGVSHAEIGAHLLSLWGMSDTMIEAVAYHHEPGKTPTTGKSVLAAVHVANGIDYCNDGEPEDQLSLYFDSEYMISNDIVDSLPELSGLCETQTA